MLEIVQYNSYFWTLDLDPDPENLEPEKTGPWKTWTLKNLDLEKRGKRLGMEK